MESIRTSISSEYIQTIALACTKSARIQKEYIRKAETSYKEDNSIVTEADIKCEEVIKETILNRFPESSILGEETGSKDGDSGLLWTIDPIDGTRHYARGGPLYSTLISVVKDGELIAGGANFPELNRFYHAQKGEGAYCNGRKLSVSSGRDQARILAWIEDYREEHTDDLDEMLDESYVIKHHGSGFELSNVADGVSEAVLSMGAKPWDIGPGTLLVREAGGRVSTIDGKEDWESLSKSEHTIVSNGELHEDLLSALNHEDS